MIIKYMKKLCKKKRGRLNLLFCNCPIVTGLQDKEPDVKKPSFTMLILLLLLWQMPVVHAESVASYKDLREQMLKKSADADKKKGSRFTAAERKLMKDSLAQAQQDHPSPGLKPGQKAPDFTLNNAFGKPLSLSAQLKNGPVVLVFYRGAWCPFCNLHLHVLQKNIDNFKKYGATLIAVTPQQPDQSVKQIINKQRRHSMKKRMYCVTGFLVLFLAVAFLLPTVVTAQSKSTMHIKFSTWHPPMSREVQTVWIPMLNELKKRSNGRITHTMYAGN